MRLLSYGESAVLVELDREDGVPAWRAELERQRAAGHLLVEEVVPGARTVLLDGVADLAEALTLLRDLAPAPVPAGNGPLVTLPVTFDGADLGAVAAAWDTDPEGAVQLLTHADLRVAFCGFSPGFAYCTGLPERLHLPRRDTPRTSVPAGSLALAGPYVGVYPTASPGGWHLLGRTGVTLFDVDADPPALLAPGTRVRLAAT